MPIHSVAAFVEAVRRSRVLEPAQVEELAGLARSYSQPKLLANALLQRGWLTDFQVEMLFADRDQELSLDQYIVLDRLGSGGMGAVYKARHRRLDRIDALKVIRSEHLNQANAVERFQQEARAAARLKHPHIVTIYDAGEDKGIHFLAMEYVDGIDLARLVRERGPLPVGQACTYIRQAALGLQHAYERDLVHRDIKPHNLFLDTSIGAVKVLDLGLARFARSGADAATMGALTAPGAIMGTPDYIAPEQAMNARNADIRSDLYSLGCTLYFLLTGQPPFPGGDVMEKLMKHQLETPATVERLRPEVPAGLAAVVRKLMAKRPEERYQTPSEAAQALEEFCDTAVFAPPVAHVPQPSEGIATLNLTESGVPAVEAPTAQWHDQPPAAKGHRWRALFLVVVVFGLGALLLNFMGVRSSNRTDSDSVGTPDGPGTALKPEPWPQPTEVTAVLGEPRARHWGGVRCLSCSPDGSLLASGGDDGNVFLWDAVNGRLRTSCQGHTSPVRGLGFTPDGKRLFSGGGNPQQNGALRCWDADTGKEQAVKFPPRKWITAVAVAADGRHIVLGGETGGIIDLDSGRETTPWDELGPIAAVTYVPRSFLVAVAASNVVILWDVAAQKCQKPLAEHTAEVLALAAAPNGQVLASAGADMRIRLWDPASGKCVGVLNGHKGAVRSLAFSPDSSILASGGDDEIVNVWNVARQQTTQVLGGPRGSISALTFSADGHTLFSGGDTGTIRRWDLATGQDGSPAGDQFGPATCLAFSPDSKRLLSGGADGRVRLWDWETKRSIAVRLGHEGRVNCIAWSSDGQTAASGGSFPFLDLWALPDNLGRKTSLQSEQVTCAVYVPRRSILVTGTDDNFIHFWDTNTAKHRKVRAGNKGRVLTLACTPDGKHVVSGSVDGTLRLWSIDEENPVGKPLANFPAWIQVAAFSPDGRTLVYGGGGDGDLTVCDWNGTTAKPRGVLKGHVSLVRAIDFAFDGSALVSTGADGRIVLWNMPDGRKQKTWQLPGPVFGIAFSRDGQYLVSANGNGTLFVLHREP